MLYIWGESQVSPEKNLVGIKIVKKGIINGMLLVVCAGGLASCIEEERELTQVEEDAARGNLFAKARLLVDTLAEERYWLVEKEFDTTFRTVMTREALQQSWEAVLDHYGEFVQQTKSRKRRIEGYNVVFVTCKFEHGALDVQVVYDNEGEVGGLYFVQTE